jgi:predicted nucleotidyltransferase
MAKRAAQSVSPQVLGEKQEGIGYIERSGGFREIRTVMLKNKEKEVIKRFKIEVAKVLGDRLDRVVLFGSRARGDAEEDSDFDFLVIVRAPDNEDKKKIREITAQLSIEYDTVITALVIPSKDFREDRYFYLYENIQKEGRVV